MAAAITTTATTLEGQLAEIAGALQTAEAAENLNRVTVNFNAEAGSVVISANLPAVFGSSGAALSMTVSEYLGL